MQQSEHIAQHGSKFVRGDINAVPVIAEACAQPDKCASHNGESEKNVPL